MIALVAQMLGCLAAAAMIGGIVGWLLRHRSAATHEQQLTDKETELRIKGQALDTALYELKMKTSSLMMLEARVDSLESLGRSAQQELEDRQKQIQALQHELSASVQRQAASESDTIAHLQRIAQLEAVAAAQAQEAGEAAATLATAQQQLRTAENELLSLRASKSDPAGRSDELDRLRALVNELEPARGRVHWLEVQLCEKEAQHRGALQKLNAQLAEQSRRIEDLFPQSPEEGRDHPIDALEERIKELQSFQVEITGQTKKMGENEEEISALRKRIGKVRAALRVRTDGGHVVTRANGPTNQLSLQIGHTKPSNGPRKDDLKKIPGIGPVIERALNKMGTYTYVQIARWTTGDIDRVAEKLGSIGERIKRDNWIASAKKKHREKYGEKI